MTMGWKLRNGKAYFYKSVREGTHVRSVYEGGGISGSQAAELERLVREIEAADRAIVRQQVREILEADRPVIEYSRAVALTLKASLTGAGYRQHARGAWRMGRATKAKKTELQPVRGDATPALAVAVPRDHTEGEAREILRRAAEGDTTVMPDIQAMLAGPRRAAWLKCVGDPSEGLRSMLIASIAGNDVFQREAMEEHTTELEKDLTPPEATALERILVRRVVVCWLAVHQAERMEVRNLDKNTPPFLEILQRRIERAHGRLLSSLKALGTAQRLRGGSTTVSVSRTEKLTLKSD
jgi:hypothetical protein